MIEILPQAVFHIAFFRRIINEQDNGMEGAYDGRLKKRAPEHGIGQRRRAREHVVEYGGA